MDDDGFDYPDYGGEEITIQDCWRARGRHSLHDAVRELMREHVAQITTPRVASYCISGDAGLALGGADSASLVNLLFDKPVPL